MKTLKEEQIVQNKHGHYTKIIAIKGGFVYFCGWHLKKEEAEKRQDSNGNQPINVVAFGRAVEGDGEVKTNSASTKKAKEKK